MKILNKKELSSISGAAILLDLLNKRKLTNIFPSIRPSGLSSYSSNDYSQDCGRCCFACDCNDCGSGD